MRKHGGAIAIAWEPNITPMASPKVAESEQAVTSRAEKELEVIERAKHDPRAFAPLYDEYADSVWRFAMSRLGNPERAADVTSQTFVKAIQALPKFKPKLQGESTSFQPWLMMIARNAVIDEQRKHRPAADIDSPAVEHHLASDRGSPETAVIRQSEQQRVRDAIAQLSARQRQIVELRIAGYSGKEIAEHTGMTLNGVRTAHHRAYARLRDLLAEEI